MTRRFTLEDEEEEVMQPGRWSRIKQAIGLSAYEDEEEIEEEEPAKRRGTGRELRLQTNRGHQIYKIAIKSLDDARRAADMLKERRPVILNLEQTEEDVARRAIDWFSGATYALDGFQERVGEKVFLFTPSNTLIASDEEEETSSTRGLYVNGR